MAYAPAVGVIVKKEALPFAVVKGPADAVTLGYSGNGRGQVLNQAVEKAKSVFAARGYEVAAEGPVLVLSK
jgi:hypothetical protein